MKLYTLTYDDARPTKQQVNIPTNSDYKIGIKVFSHRNEGKPNQKITASNPNPARVIAEDLHLLPPQVSLVADDGTTISADSEIVNGYVTFTLKTDDNPSFKNYKVRVQNDTFNEVLFAESSGNTQGRVQTRSVAINCDTPITLYPSDKVLRGKPNDLEVAYGCISFVGNNVRFTSYGTEGYPNVYAPQNSAVGEGIDYNNWSPAKITQEDITAGKNKITYSQSVKGAYYLEVYTVPYENTFDLAINIFKSQQGDIGTGGGGDVPADVATKTWVESQISGFVDESELTAYATVDSLSDYVETSDLTAYATVDSLSAKVGKAATGQAPVVNTVNSVYETDWATLSATADANTFYVVLPDPE